MTDPRPAAPASEQEIDRVPCLGDDGSPLTVIEYRHVDLVDTRGGVRERRGARRLALASGEAVRYIDPKTFEVIATGELITRSTEPPFA